MSAAVVNFNSHQIADFCQKHHIKRLAFFGSVVREDFGAHSDIDVLVDFEDGQVPGFDFFLIEKELSQLLGRRVDLQTASFLSPEIRRAALAETVVVYE